KILYTDLEYLICKFCILASSGDIVSAVQLQFQRAQGVTKRALLTRILDFLAKRASSRLASESGQRVSNPRLASSSPRLVSMLENRTCTSFQN
ncbi:hypothetical protein L195_g050495, partial [Trifolium pratense]